MGEPSQTGVVYRVAYNREGTKRQHEWKYKLFNTEASAQKYIDALHTPISDKTPEKYRNLGKVHTRMSFGMVRWSDIADVDGVVEHVEPGVAWTAVQRVWLDRWKGAYPERNNEPTVEELDTYITANKETFR